MGILALGGGAFDEPVCAWVAERLPAGRPSVVMLPTATADAPDAVVRFYELFGRRGVDVSHVGLHVVPPDDARERIATADGVMVSGGNTANALAIWRLHGIDDALRTAWQRGALLWGSSAGMICWFEAGVTDSSARRSTGCGRAGLPGGLGLPALRRRGAAGGRPTSGWSRDEGFPSGVAADDGCGLWYEGRELQQVLSFREGARAYRVTPGGSAPLEL